MEEIQNFTKHSWKLRQIPNLYDMIQNYLDKCLELCWLMVIQDPPVFMDCNIKVSKKKKRIFDKNLYKAYTKEGKRIIYVVWPVLFLHEGDGPVLSKGVAQGKGKQTVEEKSMYTKPPSDSQFLETYKGDSQRTTTTVFDGTMVKDQSAEVNGNIIVNSFSGPINMSKSTNDFVPRREAFVDENRSTCIEKTAVLSNTWNGQSNRKSMTSVTNGKTNKVKPAT